MPDAEIVPALAEGVVDPRQVALLEDTPPSMSAPVQGSDTARYQRLSPESFSVAANAASPGLLVLSEIWDPGWHATVAGVATPVLRTNGIFMAVPLEAGEHTVVFRYQPPHFWLGVAITLAGALALLAGGIWLYRREREPGRAAEAATS